MAPLKPMLGTRDMPTGIRRAGSTLVEQILSSHSQAEGTMELQEIMAITRDLREMSAAPESTA